MFRVRTRMRIRMDPHFLALPDTDPVALNINSLLNRFLSPTFQKRIVFLRYNVSEIFKNK